MQVDVNSLNPEQIETGINQWMRQVVSIVT